MAWVRLILLDPNGEAGEKTEMKARWVMWIFGFLSAASLLTSCFAPMGDEGENTSSLMGVRGYVGLPLREAIAKAERKDLRWRVVEVDGEPRSVTLDIDPDRLNFSVENGIVTGVDRL